ncbi:MAG: RNA polymerase sigma-70 factor [Prevotellaceae bacterium]|nr:RNA polymerase sigma-70 factor [Prevotellaceae bacterium]
MTDPLLKKLLIRVSRHDSQTAFRAFYEQTYDRLFRMAYYYTHRELWAQEIALDVYAKLWEQRAKLTAIVDIYDYCFILIKNASLNYLDKEERRAARPIDGVPDPSSNLPSPEETLLSAELMNHYLQALERLPKRCREIFVRIREEGESYAEVATALNISTKTVDAQLQKATKRLREELASYHENVCKA